MTKRCAVRAAGGRSGPGAGRRRPAQIALSAALALAAVWQAPHVLAQSTRGNAPGENPQIPAQPAPSRAPVEIDAQPRRDADGRPPEEGSSGEAAPAGRADSADWPFTSTTDEFVVANAQFVLMHELAHLVIEEKRVPILGPEESAADYIAAMMLIRPRTTPPEGADALIEVAVNTADGFALAWQRRERVGAAVPYWDNHSLTVQRLSTLACLLYGSDPERFSTLLTRLDMPAPRARACVREYQQAAYAVDWLFDTYARKATDPPGAPIEIRFEKPPTLTSQRLLDAIRRQGFVERTFEFIGNVVALEKPAAFVMRSCRQPQAMWLSATRELVFCYELLDAYAAMSLERNRSDVPRLTAPGQ